MNWNQLLSTGQVDQLLTENVERTSLIFKHSTRCSISATALDRLQRKWKLEEVKNLDTYFLDLIQYREVSNYLAEKLNIQHQSPQVLIVKDGRCIYNESHFGINYEEISEIALENRI